MELTNSDDKPLANWDPEQQLSQWLGDIHLMKSYATSEGMPIPGSAAERLGDLTNAIDAHRSGSKVDLGGLISKTLEVHSLFSAIVAPATPRTLQATGGGRSKTATVLQNPLVLGMLVLTVVGLVLFITSVVVGDGRTSAIWRQLSFLGAAIIGATFYSLFTALKYIVSRTYDPQYGTVYLVRFLLGVVAGVILANFGKDIGANLNGINVGGPLFALIGGYSSEVVNQILMRVSETLLASIKGSGDDQVKAKEEELKASKARAVVDQERVRADLVDQIATLAENTKDLSNAADVQKRIDDLKNKLQQRSR
jgi:hypothetical protein